MICVQFNNKITIKLQFCLKKYLHLLTNSSYCIQQVILCNNSEDCYNPFNITDNAFFVYITQLLQ